MSHHPSYTARVNRVMDHIEAHLDETLDLYALAGIAQLSPFHFHRLFQALTGETLADRVRRRRLEVAAGRLLMRPDSTALRIALDVGFNSAEAFTRAFRAHFGVTPTSLAARRLPLLGRATRGGAPQDSSRRPQGVSSRHGRLSPRYGVVATGPRSPRQRRQDGR